ncbi:MAG: glycosyltransferase family 4 protein, partial [Candidatus Aenigmatarchaeota archaeon]
AGRGGYRKELIELRNRLGMEEDVNFLGFVEDSVRYLNAADVSVVPSLFEPFGLTAIEAMACGVPVVASNIGGLKEIILDGDDGFLFDDEGDMVEKINLLLEREDVREEMGNKARKTAEMRFSWETIAKKTEDVYRKVI